MIHPEISLMNDSERRRMRLALAEQRRLARRARNDVRAARRLDRLAGHDSPVGRWSRLRRVWLRRAW
jgi:hypothetical protein